MKSEVLAMITGKDQNVLSERVLALPVELGDVAFSKPEVT